MKRVVALVLIVALVLLAVGVAGLTVLASLGTSSDESRSVELGDPPPTAGEPVDPSVTKPPARALAPFYSQQLEWESCRGEFVCATMQVPLDYAEPRGERIEIAVLKVPASKPRDRIGSMVVNPGGPGAPGTQYAAQSSLVFRDALLDSFDIVGFDPRGTGSSTAVDCLSDDDLDEYLATDPDPDTVDEEQEYASWMEQMGSGCVEKSGDLAAHVTTVEAARDIDVLRALLGEDQLTYFGASYGTKLGATYADLFPDRAGRLVLDGAVDLSASSRDLSLDQAGGFEVALRAYVEDCLKESSCFLGDSVEAGLDRISSFLDEVDRAPLSTRTDRDLQVGNAFYGIVAPLYNKDYWFLLTNALEAGFDGDGSALLELSDLYSSRGPDGYTDNGSEAFFAINCLDDPYAITPGEVGGELADFEEASPTFGPVFAWGLISCGGQEAEATEKPRDVTAAGAPPILVIGTTRDPATPMKWAESLAEQLESGVLIRRDGDGHTGYNAGNACVDKAVEGFLVNGDVPPGDLDC